MNEKELKQKLTPEQFHVLREKGTERPFSGKYVHPPSLRSGATSKTEDGKYVCMVCSNPLFSSDAQFDSGTGWPSFDKPIEGSVKYQEEPDGRTEIICAKCNSHLGHVFDDGPTATGKRYCINSVCLDLKK
jgi:peptide-methionine (R)-S-oxide reductase